MLMGVGVTLEAVLLLLMPGWATRMGILPPIPEEATVALRVAGAALAGESFPQDFGKDQGMGVGNRQPTGSGAWYFFFLLLCHWGCVKKNERSLH